MIVPVVIVVIVGVRDFRLNDVARVELPPPVIEASVTGLAVEVLGLLSPIRAPGEWALALHTGPVAVARLDASMTSG